MAITDNNPTWPVCFSRPGWWQTLCGLDAANQGFGWTNRIALVRCEDCKAKIKKGAHRKRRLRDVLVPKDSPHARPS